MGIPGLINAIGAGERVSLSKIAISHLQQTARPIRVAVDISIWLFQVQSGRGGKNPELRTLFFRLLKLLALPVHPLFVYDGRHKPPFKRGKSVSYGSTPLIRRSKDLIERFRFPWHEAPGEAEAECARLQQAGVVDAVMSNDVDALMFGSKLTIMNFSKESGSGSAAATHVTCYRMGEQPHGHVPNVPLDRAGMILFAMLSGGDYAEGLKGCGSKLAAEIALAGFGEDLLNTLSSHASDLDSGLSEWRERLQYELDENESGYFKRKHKAVRIPEDFPNRTILKYYAEPIVSTEEEVATLKSQLRHSWDREIDAMAIRAFTADNFEWNYRSGARKVIKLLAEPLVSYRLRLQRPVKGVPHGTLAPECDTPWLQKVHRSRANFGTDGTPELQVDMLPIDVVGIDLFAEEPNPPMPSQDKSTQSTAQSGAEEGGVDEEDLEDAPADETARAPPPSPSKSRVTRRYDPLAIEKVWVFETVAKLGIPDIVEKWDKEQAEKAENAKKTTTRNPPKRRTGPKKKGPIDPGMQRGSILKYGTLTKERSELSSSNKTRLIDAATSKSQGEGTSNLRNPPPAINLDVFQLSPSMYPEKRDYFHTSHATSGVDELIDSFSSLSTTTHTPSIKRHPMSLRSRPQINLRTLVHGERELDDYSAFSEDVVSSQGAPSGIRLSYVVSDGNFPQSGGVALPRELGMPPVMPEKKATRSKKATKKLNATEGSPGVDELEEAIESLTLSLGYDESCSRHQPSASRADGFDNDHPDQIHKPTSIPESEHCSDARKSRNRQTPQEEDSSSVRKKKDPKPIKTVGHAENISTFDGFWEVHNDAEEVSDTTRSTRATTGKDEGNKKRFSRVSILDMI